MRPHAVGPKIRSSLQLYGSFECIKSIPDFLRFDGDVSDKRHSNRFAGRGLLKNIGDSK